MRLDKVEIHSYRSIINQTLTLVQPCLGLIGLNESGKSNLLNAIRFLDANFPVSRKDRSKIDDSWPMVTYSFRLERDEHTEIRHILRAKLNSTEEMLDKIIPLNFELVEGCSFTKTVSLNGTTEAKAPLPQISFEIKLPSGFTAMIRRSDSQATIPTPPDVQQSAPGSIIVLPDAVPVEDAEKYGAADLASIRQLIEPSIAEFLRSRLPAIRFWVYEPSYILPYEMSYDEFAKNSAPHTNSTVLYNIFLLSTRLGIKDEKGLLQHIEGWKTDSGKCLREADIVTEDVNSYIKKIWQEEDVQQVRIALEEKKITVHVHDPSRSDANYYDMEVRSDGFRTFVSFILTAAAEADSGLANNFILLLDEPETHLHPGSVKFMREELVKLSLSNTVVFATHSVFMIDRKTLSRHVIVKKNGENTQLVHAQRSKLMQEALLYEALGTSVDEFSIRLEAIVLEGETDLLLFQYYLENFVGADHPIRRHELYDGGGTDAILNFFKDKILPNQAKWIIILDNDTPGRNLPKQIESKAPQLGAQLQYKYYSIEQTIGDVELEDLLPGDLLLSALKSTTERLSLSIKFDCDLDEGRPFSDRVAEFKARNKVPDPKAFEQYLKETILLLISKAIEEIKSKDSPAKARAFSERFPKYTKWVESLVASTAIADVSIAAFADAAPPPSEDDKKPSSGPAAIAEQPNEAASAEPSLLQPSQKDGT